MAVTSVEEARKIQDEYKLKEDVKSFRKRIQTEISYLKNLDSPDVKEASDFLINELEGLYEMPINSKKELDYAEWLFNNGKLRTQSEIIQRRQDKRNYQYIKSGDYEMDCFINKTLWGAGGFIIPAAICIAKWWKSMWVFSIIPAIFIGGISSLIGMYIASEMNVERAKKYKVPPDHPRYIHDKNEMTVAKAAGVISAVSVGKHTKKAIKNVANVDSWKEFK